MTETNFTCQIWTTTERDMVVSMRDRGLTLREMADRLPGRTWKAVGNFISRHNLKGKPKNNAPIPPAPIVEEILWSEALRDATLAAIASFASANRLNEQDARTILLGREPQGQVARLRAAIAYAPGHSPFEVVSGRQGVAA